MLSLVYRRPAGDNGPSMRIADTCGRPSSSRRALLAGGDVVEGRRQNSHNRRSLLLLFNYCAPFLISQPPRAYPEEVHCVYVMKSGPTRAPQRHHQHRSLPPTRSRSRETHAVGALVVVLSLHTSYNCTSHQRGQMYWPTSAARILAVPPPIGDDPVLKVKPSRRGNLFATLTETGIGIWDVRVSVVCASCGRAVAHS